MVGGTVSHYRILEKLGGGGMGVVYEAEDTRLKRRAALKFLPADLVQDDDAKERFILEAQAASALDHPNVCTIYEIDEAQDGQLFIAMARYDGETLKTRLDRGRLSVSESVDLAVQTARGLACAHDAGIVHRDIKPANLMLTARGEVKILDFGLAKLSRQGGLTRTGSILGTAAYMAPEQIKGSEADLRVDVWALGVVMYEMLAGAHPFGRSEEVAVLNAIMNDEPRPIRDVRSDVPVELARIVHRALQKERQSRYASAGELLKDLTPFQGALTSSLSSIAPARRPAVGTVIVAALLALAILTGSWLRSAAKERWARDTAIPEIRRLVEQDQYVAAYDLAVKAEGGLPNDLSLRELWPAIATTATIETEPEGADILYRSYDSTDADWRPLGQSPIKDVRLPRGAFRWKIQKAGFATVELAAPSVNVVGNTIRFALAESAGVPADMVMVPASAGLVGLTGFDRPAPGPLRPFLIDRHEVTNREFKEFVDAGGYEKSQYWKQPFVKAGRVLSALEAMAEFRDSTGRPGPAAWELGEYPQGQAEYPVGGVSWFEAAAYAEFRGKQLPTVYHWSRAALAAASSMLASPMVEASNFGGKGPQPVGQGGIGSFGTYDMAGNVREWCWNASGELRWILGGAWNDASYMFSSQYGVDPFGRAPENGFRLVKYLDGLPDASLTNPVRMSQRDYPSEKPISDEVFEAYRKQYAPIRSELNSKVESRDEKPEAWIQEKVTFDAGYGEERTTAFLFLPKRSQPPYQVVVFFPPFISFSLQASSANLQTDYWDFVVKSGRAVVWPIYKGSYERKVTAPQAQNTEESFRFKRAEMIQWRQDLSRTLDYLNTRPEFDAAKVAYLGRSYGASTALPLLALEERLKVAILLSGGLPPIGLPAEVDPINFAPRTRIPVLLVSSNQDNLLPVDTSQKPLMSLLAADQRNKRYVTADGGHTQLPRGMMIRETLAWLDQYLGTVK